MGTILKTFKMDMAICRTSLIAILITTPIVGIVGLFCFSPLMLLLCICIVEAISAVSTLFSVESKSNMEYLYGCLPVNKILCVLGRTLSCLVLVAIPSIISYIFLFLSIEVDLYKAEEIRVLIDNFDNSEVLIVITLVIFMSFMGCGNIIFSRYTRSVEFREVFEGLILIADLLVVGLIFYGVCWFKYEGDISHMVDSLVKWVVDGHQFIFCYTMIKAGIIYLLICGLVSGVCWQKNRI